MTGVSEALTMRETAHYNGGREWFGYLHQCVEKPRLTRFDRYTRKDRAVTSTWRVDGEDRASMADAMADLEYTPRLSAAELNVLAQFAKPVMAKGDFPAFKDAYEHLRTLAAKGIVWWEDGKVEVRADAAAEAIGAAESNASGTPAFDVVAPAVKAARAALAQEQSK